MSKSIPDPPKVEYNYSGNSVSGSAHVQFGNRHGEVHHSNLFPDQAVPSLD